MFMDWFDNCFVREVEQYLPRNNLASKVVLILYKTKTLQHALPNIEVILLVMLPNTTSLIHPLDQGMTAIL